MAWALVLSEWAQHLCPQRTYLTLKWHRLTMNSSGTPMAGFGKLKIVASWYVHLVSLGDHAAMLPNRSNGTFLCMATSTK